VRLTRGRQTFSSKIECAVRGLRYHNALNPAHNQVIHQVIGNEYDERAAVTFLHRAVCVWECSIFCTDGGPIGSGFSSPWGVAVDASGTLYVADAGNNAIKQIAARTGVISTLGSGFSGPEGVAVDASGNVYVADLRRRHPGIRQGERRADCAVTAKRTAARKCAVGRRWGFLFAIRSIMACEREITP
jgi:sugar lactone lactonase YvrE